MVQPVKHHSVGSPNSGPVKRNSGQVILSQPSYPDRMVNQPRDIHPDLPPVAHTPNRLVCHQVQQETFPVHVPSPGQGSLCSDCFKHIIGEHGGIPFPQLL